MKVSFPSQTIASFLESTAPIVLLATPLLSSSQMSPPAPGNGPLFADSFSAKFELCSMIALDSVTQKKMPNPTAPTAENISFELDVLLGAADIKPPYIIVCHAYGGIIAREFLHLKQFKGELHDIVGLVFVEGDQENTTALRPDENVKRMSEGQDWLRLTGLYQDMVLDPEDREGLYLEAETAKFKETAEAECGEVANSRRELGQKKQLEADPPLLGSVPVSVVMGDTTRDHERIYEAAVRSGKEGIPSPAAWQRKMAEFKELDETLQLANLNLSTKGSIAIAGNSGHNVHLTEPDAIVGEVQWILDTINNQQ
ncbi:alpha/beta hydrolase [Histoplasma capsulatum var. duboisii H88]|uniref:Alpha/beta hydrolase n=1 Tax=Ajellomyces capsulatus (strain H88) TaxID=544711 RepID=F0UIM5_AJEC8|nr:alpha/beta hydrolase [Histoplasma capsulatum var. duboisii H88]